MDFQRGDRVVYGIQGVCSIVDVESRKVNQKMVEYFVLVPCAQADARYYVPMHNQTAVAKMRKLLTCQEVEALLGSEEVKRDYWIPEEHQRREHYRSLIAQGTCAELLGMVRSLHRQRQLLMEAGRKFHICDENFLRDAKRNVTAEVAQILGVSPHEAEEYLRQHLEND